MVKARQYGDGSFCEGILSQDIISIGSPTQKLSTLAYFGLITADDGNFLDMDGILGLGFKNLSDGNPTFVDMLQQSQVIRNRVFALYLNTGPYNESEYGSPASYLQIGGYDLKTYSTAATFEAVFDVTEAAWWTVAFTSCSMNGTIIATDFTGIFDSGTSLTWAPFDPFVEIYYFLVNTTARNCTFDFYYYLILCDDTNSTTLPGLTLRTSTGTITGSAKNLWLCDSGFCILLIMPGDMWIFGDSFLRTYYTVYDMDKLTISFASAVASTSFSDRLAVIGFLAYLIGFS
jgi:hypothetical protein